MCIGFSVLVLAFLIAIRHVYGGHIVIEVSDDARVDAFYPKQFAASFGMTYIGQLFADSKFHHFYHTNRSYAEEVIEALQDRQEFSYASIQHPKTRDKRRFSIDFNDPYFPRQWYLNDITRPHYDLNVGPAWADGITGHGVTCLVLDDGIFHTNPDLAPNYEAAVSADFSDLLKPSRDPLPDADVDDSHGTSCAAIMAAAANNSYCGVGVAYNARIGGVRILAGNKKVTDAQEAIAVAYANSVVDVYSASWGPTDNGLLVDRPGHLVETALKNGVAQGRGGRGAVYVWASGNGGRDDNCAMDGYASSLETLTIAALNQDGKPCVYSEPCASALTSAYVGFGRGWPDARTGQESVVVPGLDGVCRSSFQGTSAAAPLVAGAVALVLQANPLLGWRDVQHLAVRASKPRSGPEWTRNAAGFSFHEALGFGALDASRMVDLARNWKSLPARKTLSFRPKDAPRVMRARKEEVLSVRLRRNTMSVIEVVEVRVSSLVEPRGALEVRLRSPAGTTSRLLTRRPLDISKAPLKDWPLRTVHFWGEGSAGEWRLMIRNHSPNSGKLQGVRFLFHGYDL